MRMELKVYLSHTDLARIQEASNKAGMSMSTFVRTVALAAADSLGVRSYTTILRGEVELPGLEKLRERVGG